jgi:lipoic acid synthetase
MLAERRLPPWFKVKFPGGEKYLRLKALMREQGLHTICEEARCPNIGECWEYGTATFMILGEICTRRCAYCNVTTGRPKPVDLAEPLRVAEAAKAMGLRYAVVTSPNRDDLPDGGAALFAATITEIRRQNPGCKVEVLIPDFMGAEGDLLTVLDAAPDVLNHNIETVASLFKRVRPKGAYDRSIQLLANVKRHRPAMTSKSGIILGMGESDDEVLETMADLREAGCDILTLGQYLRPSERHIPVARFVTPVEFASLKTQALTMGFKHVESGPLVRSSYHAHEHAESAAAATA